MPNYKRKEDQQQQQQVFEFYNFILAAGMAFQSLYFVWSKTKQFKISSLFPKHQKYTYS